MKITVINGTEKHGVTYRMKEIFLEAFKDKADITEFYLPKDCPNFCMGCTACFMDDEHKCKDVEYVQKIEAAMLEADLLVFASPVYVYHATGAMKAMLDHFGYRWMVHRPHKDMFGKRAVIITQSLGSGEKSAAKDIKDSLSWWGITSITECRFKLMSNILWDDLPENKRQSIIAGLNKTAKKMKRIDYSKPARSGVGAKGMFLVARLIQKNIGKTNPASADYLYWKENGWLEDKRPWKSL